MKPLYLPAGLLALVYCSLMLIVKASGGSVDVPYSEIFSGILVGCYCVVVWFVEFRRRYREKVEQKGLGGKGKG